MKRSTIALVFAGLTAMSQSAWSQKAEPAANPGILGYLDPQTGAFRPVVQSAASDEDNTAAAVMSVGGKLSVTFNINVVSSIPSNTQLACSVSAAVAEVPTTTSSHLSTFTENATVIVSRSGSKATCTVVIPYSWELNTPSTDMVSLTFSVSALNPAVSGGTSGTSLAGEFLRLSTHSGQSMKVPANASTTNLTAAFTI